MNFSFCLIHFATVSVQFLDLSNGESGVTRSVVSGGVRVRVRPTENGNTNASHASNRSSRLESDDTTNAALSQGQAASPQAPVVNGNASTPTPTPQHSTSQSIDSDPLPQG